MIWWHRRDARPKSMPEPRLKPLETKKKVNPRSLELQAAKEILAEIFHARPEDIEEMIKSRLEEGSRAVEQMPASDGLWPVAFCLGE